MTDSDIDRDYVYDLMAPSESGPTSQEGMAVDDLAALHDAAVTFVALYDQRTDFVGIPDDLDTDTKRQLSTADTLLRQAISGLEDTAIDRLNELDTEEHNE